MTKTFAPAETHPDPTANPVRTDGFARRRPVVEQARQRHRKGDAQRGFGGIGHVASLACRPGAGLWMNLRVIVANRVTNAC